MWIKPLRRYLGLRDPADLKHAGSVAPHDIAEFLGAWAEDDIRKFHLGRFELLFERLMVRLDALDSEQAGTVTLVYLDAYSRLVEPHLYLPVEQQPAALQRGIEACQEASRIAARLNDLPCAAHYTYRLGRGYETGGFLQSARESYDQALALYQQLSRTYPELYLPKTAVTLHGLGIALSKMRDYSAALQSFENALAVWRSMSLDGNEPNVANTLTSLGIVRKDMRSFPEAQQAFQEVVVIQSRLAQMQPEVYSPVMARTLTRLGAVQQELHLYPEAQRAFEEASVILQGLAWAQPEVYEPHLAFTLTCIGSALGKRHSYSEAQQVFEKGISLQRRLAEAEPEVRPKGAFTAAMGLFGKDQSAPVTVVITCPSR